MKANSGGKCHDTWIHYRLAIKLYTQSSPATLWIGTSVAFAIHNTSTMLVTLAYFFNSCSTAIPYLLHAAQHKRTSQNTFYKYLLCSSRIFLRRRRRVEGIHGPPDPSWMSTAAPRHTDSIVHDMYHLKYNTVNTLLVALGGKINWDSFPCNCYHFVSQYLSGANHQHNQRAQDEI